MIVARAKVASIASKIGFRIGYLITLVPKAWDGQWDWALNYAALSLRMLDQ